MSQQLLGQDWEDEDGDYWVLLPDRGRCSKGQRVFLRLGSWRFSSGGIWSKPIIESPRYARAAVTQIQRLWPVGSAAVANSTTNGQALSLPRIDTDIEDPALVPATKEDVDLVNALATVKSQLRGQVIVTRILQVACALSSICHFLHWLGCPL